MPEKRGPLTMILMAALLLIADPCMIDCTGTIWELHYQGHVVSFGDMDQQQCEDLKAEIEAQTEPFTDLECVEVDVAREEI